MGGTSGFDEAIICKTNYAHAILTQEVQGFDEITRFDAAQQKSIKEASILKLDFAVSWIITFFAYRLNCHKKTLKLFDFLVCTLNKFAISYMTAAVVIELFEINKITSQTDKNHTMQILYCKNMNGLDLDRVMDRAFILINRTNYQPEQLDRQMDKMKRSNAVKQFTNKIFGFFKK